MFPHNIGLILFQYNPLYITHSIICLPQINLEYTSLQASQKTSKNTKRLRLRWSLASTSSRQSGVGVDPEAGVQESSITMMVPARWQRCPKSKIL